MSKDIISPMGCNSFVDIKGGVHVGHIVAPISSMPYHMIDVLGGVGADIK